ncbi:peroxide stress protein YaaA [Maritimibacter sp. DP1N21-5]|uniref:peroxide stress protein YaaA n=1 Tax=Maritimibacter sp. DP1N21-5 TaxID=2836867 RepID=UPI001C45AD84|nr:peroxide stress protein YaaA [Maritimibacter sp. DP1N21-5]MBV7408284.1 peroxide stress protein YaaA [Maritimibacter sp. DP1N21-5]
MLVTISPAKRLDETPGTGTGTEPALKAEMEKLVTTTRRLGLKDIEGLMDLSPKLARLNRDRYRSLLSGTGAKQAIEMFDGDTYTGFDAGSLDTDALDYAQDHLRILSGLYGLLRPRDVIEPHRLEMGTRLATRRGKSLYEFWGDRIAGRLVEDAASSGTDTLLNCASVEYFTAADRKALTLRVITPTFYETKAGEPRIVSFFAKQARGAMARFVCENRVTDPAALAAFDAGGYVFQPAQSTPDRPVFQRDETAAQTAA